MAAHDGIPRVRPGRRTFLIGTVALLAAPPAEAQAPAKTVTIGVLNILSPDHLE